MELIPDGEIQVIRKISMRYNVLSLYCKVLKVISFVSLTTLSMLSMTKIANTFAILLLLLNAYRV